MQIKFGDIGAVVFVGEAPLVKTFRSGRRKLQLDENDVCIVESRGDVVMIAFSAKGVDFVDSAIATLQKLDRKGKN